MVTPEETHLEPVLAALEAGKHVFVEKPLATEPDHCDHMIEAAQQANRILMVGHVLRFETKYLLLKAETDAGGFGNIVSMHAKRNRPKSLLSLYGRTHPALENCIHDIDLMLWFTGKPVKKVRGYERRALGKQHPDTFWGILEFEGGTLGVVETIWLLPEAAGVILDDAFQLVGDAGIGNVRLVPEALSFWQDSGYHAPDHTYSPDLAEPRGALCDELTYFCECLLENRTPTIITPQEALQTVRITRALIESARIEKDIVLN